MINKVAPVVPAPTKEGRGVFLHLAVLHRFRHVDRCDHLRLADGLLAGTAGDGYGKTIRICAYSLITISAMLAIGTLTRLSGVDATLGLAFAGTGVLYPFFGTLLGWLGVALTGSDTASNILFGNLQKITVRTTRASADPDGGRQLFRRRHGQDDRRTIDCRRIDRDQLVRT